MVCALEEPPEAPEFCRLRYQCYYCHEQFWMAMQDPAANPPSSRLLRAAQYLRMSTEHQRYSPANQAAAIALYATAHNIGIVRSFLDEGKSGTTIKGRRGLQELLAAVVSGTADFEIILVYDISRWGRFPDADEAA